MTQQITFDGTDWDPVAKEFWLAVRMVHIWKQYNPRNEIVGVAMHGEPGELLEHKGARCKVRTGGGVEGYVTDWFIKELKADWLEKRKAGAG